MALDTRTRNMQYLPHHPHHHHGHNDHLPPQFTDPWVSQNQLDAAANLHSLATKGSPIIRTSAPPQQYMLNPPQPQYTSAPSYTMAEATAPQFFTIPRTVPSDRRLSQPNISYLSADLIPKPRQASLTDMVYRPRQVLHSASSSISSNHSFPYYGSVDSSATDYSDTTKTSSSMYPQTPAVPGQMMTTFSSKITSSAQKKHKCKVCDKRFTRPSSLQTHTYSHTGEKPFVCEQTGCGRRFSVVSNLRRHKKVHQIKPPGV